MAKRCFVEKNFRADSLKRIAQANDIIERYQEQGLTLTLRQLYYQHVAANLIPNSEKSYKNLAALISDGRLAGLIDWDAIEDRGRVADTPSEWDSIESIIDASIEQYRCARWEGQERYAELWVEKQALAGVLEPLAREFHVTLMVNKGYCVAPNTRVLTADLRWKPAREVRVGDELIGADEHVPGPKRHRRSRLAIVTDTQTFVSPRVRVVTDRGTIVVSANHPFLATRSSKVETHGYYWVEASRLVTGARIAFLARPWEEETTWEAGWLAGIYDGEGCMPRTSHATVLDVYQNPGVVADAIRSTLKSRGVLSYECGGRSSSVRDFRTHGIGNVASLLGSIRPLRMLDEFRSQLLRGRFPAKGRYPATVLRIEHMRSGPVVGITTSTGTLVTEGFISHNSSQSAMYEASKRFRYYRSRDCVLFYIGDHDPSGEDMVRDIAQRLDTFGASIEVHKLALTRDQIDEYNPPPQPAKQSDARFEKYSAQHGDESWEVDSLPPEVLSRIVRDAFDEIIDREKMDALIAKEDADREAVRKAVAKVMKRR